jgi:hypothetical protein
MAHPVNARFVLEKVDMAFSYGVTSTAPQEEYACPPAYFIMPSGSLATVTSAKSFKEAK